jgi:hypothetical protein
MNVTLAHISFPLSVPSDENQLTGLIPSEFGELTKLSELLLGTWIGLSCWHECHACSHLLAILFHQSKMI